MALFKLLKISVMLIRNRWVLKQRQNVKSIHILIKMVDVGKKKRVRNERPSPPFLAIIRKEEMKLVLILNVINSRI